MRLNARASAPCVQSPRHGTHDGNKLPMVQQIEDVELGNCNDMQLHSTRHSMSMAVELNGADTVETRLYSSSSHPSLVLQQHKHRQHTQVPAQI